MIDRDTDVLVVVDVQNDFVTGSLAFSPGAGEAAIPWINKAAALFDHVIIVADWHPPRHISFASAHPHEGGLETGTFWKQITLPEGGDLLVFPDHCVQGTWGAELAPGLELDKAELVLRKGYRRDCDSFGGFIENDEKTLTGLGGYLKARNMKRVFCCGCGRYGCVMHTAIGASLEGFEVYMIDEATAGKDIDMPEHAAIGNAAMARAGVSWLPISDLSPAI